MRGYSEQLSEPLKLALTEIDDVTFEQQSPNNMIARRQKLLQLSKAVVMRIRELGLKQVGNEFMTGTQITNDILK